MLRSRSWRREERSQPPVSSEVVEDEHVVNSLNFCSGLMDEGWTRFMDAALKLLHENNVKKVIF